MEHWLQFSCDVPWYWFVQLLSLLELLHNVLKRCLLVINRLHKVFGVLSNCWSRVDCCDRGWTLCHYMDGYLWLSVLQRMPRFRKPLICFFQSLSLNHERLLQHRGQTQRIKKCKVLPFVSVCDGRCWTGLAISAGHSFTDLTDQVCRTNWLRRRILDVLEWHGLFKRMRLTLHVCYRERLWDYWPLAAFCDAFIEN